MHLLYPYGYMITNMSSICYFSIELIGSFSVTYCISKLQRRSMFYRDHNENRRNACIMFRPSAINYSFYLAWNT